MEFTRKHTANVHKSVDHIRSLVEQLAKKRDERRDGFARVIGKAMTEKLGREDEDVMKILTKRGFSRQLAKEATEIAKQKGEFSIFSVVDALTRIARRIPNAGDRLEADAKASRLLQLAA